MRIKIITALMLCIALLMCSCSINSNLREQDHAPPESYSGPALEELTVYCFKAGKADAHLIYNSKLAVLIDCGEKGFGGEIVEYIRQHGIKKLDLLIITHFDKDHVGGAAKLLKSIKPERVMQSGYPKESGETAAYLEQIKALGITPETPTERFSFRIADAELTIYPPMRQSYTDSPSNNSSLITSIRYGGRKLLFAADAENARLGEFISAEREQFDFLKVPYHGHIQQRLGAFLKSVRPSIAVITSSDAEPEDKQTLALLAEDGAAVYLTRTAPVIVKCDGVSIAAYYDN